MKSPEYTEGPEAIENFERMAVAVFKAPKGEAVKAEKKQKGKKRDSSRGEIVRKPRLSDKD